MTSKTKVMNNFRLVTLLIMICIVLLGGLPLSYSTYVSNDASDLYKDDHIELTDFDESESRTFNITLAPWVFLLGALAAGLLLAIPLAMALLMHSGGKEETYGGYGGDAGYSSPSSGYGGDYRYFFASRKKRASVMDTRCFGSPFIRNLTTLAVFIIYCVHSVNCSTNDIHPSSHPKYNEQELFGELFDVSVDEHEGRTFSVSNISLVITYVTFIVGLTMLAGFIWLAFSAGSGDSHGGYGYNRRIFTEGISDWLFSGFNFFESDGNYKRQKRSSIFEFRDQAMASKLHMLDESFRKFEMDDLGCQMLLSCESAQLETMDHPIYGDLTSKLHKFLRSAKSSRQSKSGTRVEKLLQAHREGRKLGSSCKKLYGGLCHNLMEKMDKAEEEDKARINASLEKVKEDGEKPAAQEQKDTLSFWEKKSKMAKLDMDKKMMMKKKKYRMKY